ncbi:hypothetical protein MUG91_G13n11 [Manis pentadactyla]|nr:hypothetical protein MUG91_G13n11 [Manis pentadactyla]
MMPSFRSLASSLSVVTVPEVADGSEKSGGSRCPSSPTSRETSPLSPVTKLGKALRCADPIAKVEIVGRASIGAEFYCRTSSGVT